MNKNIEKIYDDIAINAFKKYEILRENIDGKMETFRLAEIEIYLIDEDNGINDIFIHKNEKQLQNEKEYEHYSGFDICLGDGEKIYCGILVRGIMNAEKTIYGPGRVKYRRTDNEKTSIKIEVKYNEDYKEKLNFSDMIIDNTVSLENIIFKLPRVNLSNTTSGNYLSNDDLNNLDTYLNLKVRYLRIKDEKFYKKTKYLKFPPEEHREVFNALIQYKKRQKK